MSLSLQLRDRPPAALPQGGRRAGPVAARLPPDGRRLHLQHGPIDLVIEAWGDASEVEKAYRRACDRFADVLDVLVRELVPLKTPISDLSSSVRGPVARRMVAAVWPYRAVFITPMAAVAGAVADEILAAMVDGCRLQKAYVNDGGDIAFHLSPGATLRAAIVARPDHPSLDGFANLDFASPVRGLATSGWRGRSFSLGIADSVTVLAQDAATADAAATIIANAVNIDRPEITRAPANTLRDDTDLGDRLVTVAVAALPANAIDDALDAGACVAGDLYRRGLIEAAALCLQGACRIAGGVDSLPHSGRS